MYAFIFKLLDYVFAKKGLDFSAFFAVYSGTPAGTPREIAIRHCFFSLNPAVIYNAIHGALAT
jgi:hypothetical protein